MSNYKYVVTQVNKQIFHVGRICEGDTTYEYICTCNNLKMAKFVMEAIARLEEETKWQQ